MYSVYTVSATYIHNTCTLARVNVFVQLHSIKLYTCHCLCSLQPFVVHYAFLVSYHNVCVCLCLSVLHCISPSTSLSYSLPCFLPFPFPLLLSPSPSPFFLPPSLLPVGLIQLICHQEERRVRTRGQVQPLEVPSFKRCNCHMLCLCVFTFPVKIERVEIIMQWDVLLYAVITTPVTIASNTHS